MIHDYDEKKKYIVQGDQTKVAKGDQTKVA